MAKEPAPSLPKEGDIARDPWEAHADGSVTGGAERTYRSGAWVVTKAAQTIPGPAPKPATKTTTEPATAVIPKG